MPVGLADSVSFQAEEIERKTFEDGEKPLVDFSPASPFQDRLGLEPSRFEYVL